MTSNLFISRRKPAEDEFSTWTFRITEEILSFSRLYEGFELSIADFLRPLLDSHRNFYRFGFQFQQTVYRYRTYVKGNVNSRKINRSEGENNRF